MLQQLLVDCLFRFFRCFLLLSQALHIAIHAPSLPDIRRQRLSSLLCRMRRKLCRSRCILRRSLRRTGTCGRHSTRRHSSRPLDLWAVNVCRRHAAGTHSQQLRAQARTCARFALCTDFQCPFYTGGAQRMPRDSIARCIYMAFARGTSPSTCHAHVDDCVQKYSLLYGPIPSAIDIYVVPLHGHQQESCRKRPNTLPKGG